jgi:predicted RNA polymerase sigma factor
MRDGVIQTGVIRIVVAGVLLTLAGASPAASQGQPVLRLSLAEARARALDASHRLAETRARESAARAVVDARQAAFHGVRGALLQQLDRRAEARAAFDRAIALANTPAEAAHIRQHLDHLDKESA